MSVLFNILQMGDCPLGRVYCYTTDSSNDTHLILIVRSLIWVLLRGVLGKNQYVTIQETSNTRNVEEFVDLG